nr:immunoglobulin light chain junction region [Macaca mulatta]
DYYCSAWSSSLSSWVF